MSVEVNNSIQCHRRAYVVAHTSRYAEGLEAGGLCFSLPLPIFRAMVFFPDTFPGDLMLQRLLVFKTWPPAGKAIERCLDQDGGKDISG